MSMKYELLWARCVQLLQIQKRSTYMILQDFFEGRGTNYRRDATNINNWTGVSNDC